jgi:AraC-like DNA-binding protein
MKIHEFDIEKGIYKFELDEMKTEIHSHPTFEIIFSNSGGIDLEVKNQKHTNISLAIIEPNEPHKIEFKETEVVVLLIECNAEHLKKVLSKFDIVFSEGIYAEHFTNNRKELLEEVMSSINDAKIPIASDERIQECLNYLNGSSSDYQKIMKDLKLRTHLSDSRISHLFKKEIGISIKKYFVWSKLKKAFESVVREDKNMYEASMANGFYDQAHLSNAFRQMLGISPSDVYNSRMLQV